MDKFERNIEIARMLDFDITRPYPESKIYEQNGYLFGFNKERDKAKTIANELREIFLTTTILRFDTDWNWLMLAVDFVESNLKKNIKIFTNEEIRTIYVPLFGCGVIVTFGDDQKYKTKKEAMFMAISEFAIEYNKNK